jgi:hypothetical protein
MTNSVSLQQIWLHYYQLYHLKQPVFRMIADEKIGDNLEKGDTINFRQLPDFYYDTIGTDGTYTAQGYTEVNETLVVSYYRGVPQRLVQKDLEQQDTAMKVEYAQLAMNRLFIGIDADVLSVAYQGAYYVLDMSYLGGSSGTPIALSSPTVIPQLFVAANQILQLANVVYDPNLSFSKDVKLKVPKGMLVAIISPQVFSQLLLYIGGKTTVLGDKVTVSGHQGAFMGFNLYVSNNLASSVVLTLGATPTAGDTFKINGLTFTLQTSLGSTAGNVLFTTATDATTNLVAALAAPFTTTASYIKQTDNAANRLALYGISSAAVGSPATFIQAGVTMLITAVTFASASNYFGTVIQHNLFGVSNSVAMALQGKPRLDINYVSNALAKDYVTNAYFGLKVFKTQAKQLIDVQIDTTGFTQALLTNY